MEQQGPWMANFIYNLTACKSLARLDVGSARVRGEREMQPAESAGQL